MALKVPGNASLPSHSHYTTCTSWVIFFPQKYGNTDVKINIMKIARHVILKVCKPIQREVVNIVDPKKEFLHLILFNKQ